MSARMYPGAGPDERTSFDPYSAFDIPADLRELHGRYDVESTARRVRNFRYAEEWMLMLAGGWLATVPEVPVKTGLGKVIWEMAQIADVFGKRLPELRCGRKVVAASESPDRTIEKLAGVFDVLVPHLVEVYETTIRRTDQIADAPTIELLEDAVRKHRRHLGWASAVLDRLCDTDARRERRRLRGASLRASLLAAGGVTGELGRADA